VLLAGVLSCFVPASNVCGAVCNPAPGKETELVTFTVTDANNTGNKAVVTSASPSSNPGKLYICGDTATITMAATVTAGAMGPPPSTPSTDYVGWRIEKASGKGTGELVPPWPGGNARPSEGNAYAGCLLGESIITALAGGGSGPTVREFYVKPFCDGNRNCLKDPGEDYYYDTDGKVIEVQVVVPKVDIKKPKGSLDANPNPTDSWITTPCHHFDFQGVTSGSPGPYVLDIEGQIDPIPPASYKWTLDAAAGALANDTTATPTHTSPATEGQGTLTLKAMIGATDTGCKDERKLKIYKDHLARDRENFGHNTRCSEWAGSKWTFTRFNVTITMPNDWNCHGSTRHMYDGTGNGWYNAGALPPPIDGWAQKGTSIVIPYADRLDPIDWSAYGIALERGDVVAYYSADNVLQHSQTVLSGTTTYGANNRLHDGDPLQWFWYESEAGRYMQDHPESRYPITVKVLNRP
jgi:hypothetical protein